MCSLPAHTQWDSVVIPSGVARAFSPTEIAHGETGGGALADRPKRQSPLNDLLGRRRHSHSELADRYCSGSARRSLRRGFVHGAAE